MNTTSANVFLKDLCNEYAVDQVPDDATDIRALELDQADFLDIEFRIRQLIGGTTQQLVRKLTKGMSVESLRELIEEGQLSPQHFSQPAFKRIMSDDPTHEYKSVAEDHGVDTSDDDAVVEFLSNELPTLEDPNGEFDAILYSRTGLPRTMETTPMTIGRLRQILDEAERQND